MVGLSKVFEAIVLAPLLIASAMPEKLAAEWRWPVVGAGLVLLNYVLLAAAYRRGDLSIVYPISRGGMLVFLPPLAYLTIGERLTAAGWIALAWIAGGICVLQLPGFRKTDVLGFASHARGPASVFALLAASIAACYTVWDKRAIQVLSPLVYFAAYTVILGIAYAAVLPVFVRPVVMKETWRTHRTTVVWVGLLNSGSYLLTLAALQTSEASYVIALRQLSIAGGALLGWRFLGEPFPTPRRAGVALVIAGCILLALAG